MDWFEKLPDSCPPGDAILPEGDIYYRVIKGNPVDSTDFFSQRKLAPSKVFNGVDECIARSISLFKNSKDAVRLTKLPNFRGGHFVVEIVLEETDGVLKKTSSASHYSWWRSEEFDCHNAKIIQQ